MAFLGNYWQVVRGFHRDIWLVLCNWALVAFAYFGIMGVLLNLYLLRLGYAPTFIGLLIGSGQLLWAALALPSGAAGMRFGPRNTMAAGSALMAAGSALIILVEWLPAGVWSYWLIGSWLLLWAGAALHTVNGIPYLMTLSSPAQRDYAFAAQSSATAFFSFAGSLLAGFLPALYAVRLGLSLELPGAYRLGLWSAPIVFLLAAVAILLVRPVTLARPDASLGAANRRPVGILLFVTLTIFLMSAVAGAVRSFFNVYLDSGLALSTARIGLIMGVGQLLPAAAALSAPVLMARLGPGRAYSLTSLAAGLFLLPLVTVAGWVAAAISFVGVIGANAASVPARNVFTQLCVGPEWRTSASASATIGTGLGWAAMAVLGGFVIEAWGFAALFGMAAVLAFANAGLLLAYVRRGRYPAAAMGVGD